ncbi:MAG: ParB/RepB/Spo0J family partition protein [Lachnospiraceae bacterium]|nr:ParB/RepB/Spo0J family partition protein [Lachnospiraceae bacterium]
MNGWDMVKPDGLFSTQQERDSYGIGELRNVYPEEVIEFKNHTFNVVHDEDMEELINSIKENGVLEPGVAFYNEDGQLELIAGHRRRYACQCAEKQLPVLIKNITRDDAIIIMGESNLNRRTNILPSEKAFTYRAMLEAMTRQGKRTDLTSATGLPKLRARDELSKRVNESHEMIRRYIRLTYLNSNLLNLVDEKRMGIKPAVEISYLDSSLQKCIWDFYEANEVTPSHAQAIQFKKLHQQKLLDENMIIQILSEEKPNQKEGFRISSDLVSKYFSDCATSSQIENRIIKALELLEKQEKIMGKEENINESSL